MSYTAPSGNAITVVFTGRTYSTPAGDDVALNFGAMIDAEIAGGGSVNVSGAANLLHGVMVFASGSADFLGGLSLLTDTPWPASGAVRVSGGTEIYRGTTLSISSVLLLHGSAALLAAQNVVAVGAVCATGQALLNRGERLIHQGRIKLTGRFDGHVGRTLCAFGQLPALHGSADIRHGVSFHESGNIALSGSAAFAAFGYYTLHGSGSALLRGKAVFDIRREYDLSRVLFVTTRPHSIEVLTRGV